MWNILFQFVSDNVSISVGSTWRRKFAKFHIVLSSVSPPHHPHSFQLLSCRLFVFVKSTFVMEYAPCLLIYISKPTHLRVISKSAVCRSVVETLPDRLWSESCFLLLIHLPVSFNNLIEILCYPDGPTMVRNIF
jgi:hypothetical protein